VIYWIVSVIESLSVFDEASVAVSVIMCVPAESIWFNDSPVPIEPSMLLVHAPRGGVQSAIGHANAQKVRVTSRLSSVRPMTRGQASEPSLESEDIHHAQRVRTRTYRFGTRANIGAGSDWP